MRHFTSLLILVVITLVSSEPKLQKVIYDIEKSEKYFKEFIELFNKNYETEEEKNMRFEIFKDNLKAINKDNEENEHTEFGINFFTDMTAEEWKAKFTGLKYDSKVPCKVQPLSARRSNPPESLDWRKEGKVTDVKNQLYCGSCWAFSAVGNLEGQYAIKYNELNRFSEEQLVNCDKYEKGCNGGLMSNAMIWLKEHGGIMAEEDYPYTGTETSCNFDAEKVIAKVNGCYQYKPRDEDDLKAILAEVGPLAIALDATPFLKYRGNILHCGNNYQLNHGVLLVGYGKEGNQPYWIVKNSWGEDWGEQGYVRLAMYENSCNMTGDITSAVIA